MKAQTHHFLIGLFVVSGTLLLAFGVIVLGGSRLLQRRVLFETYLEETVQGLEDGSPVKLRGVKVGEVSDIALASQLYDTQQHLVVVRIALRPAAFKKPADEEAIRQSMQDLVDRGLRIRLASAGLTGVAYLEADFDEPRRHPAPVIDWTPAHPYVPSSPSTITRVTNTLEAVLDSLKETDIKGAIGSAKAALDSFRRAVDEADVAGVSHEMRDLLRTTRERMNTSLDRVDEFVATANKMVTDFDTQLKASQWQTAVTELAATGKAARETLATVDAAVRRVGHTVGDETRTLHELLGNLRDAAQSLANLTALVERNPSLLLLGEPPRKNR